MPDNTSVSPALVDAIEQELLGAGIPPPATSPIPDDVTFNDSTYDLRHWAFDEEQIALAAAPLKELHDLYFDGKLNNYELNQRARQAVATLKSESQARACNGCNAACCRYMMMQFPKVYVLPNRGRSTPWETRVRVVTGARSPENRYTTTAMALLMQPHGKKTLSIGNEARYLRRLKGPDARPVHRHLHFADCGYTDANLFQPKPGGKPRRYWIARLRLQRRYDNANGIVQPLAMTCKALKNNRCSVYGERPYMCSAFRCSGETSGKPPGPNELYPGRVVKTAKKHRMAKNWARI